MNITRFGVYGDGATDNTAALQSSIDAAAPGSTIHFPPGIYNHNEVVRVRTRGITLLGTEDSVLVATNPDRTALIIEEDDVTIQGVEFHAATTTRRGAGWHARIAIMRDVPTFGMQPVMRTTIRDCRIVNGGPPGSALANSASTCGIIAIRAQDFEISGNVVRRSLADGIHITGGSRNGVVANNEIQETGDDMIAVVSYAWDGALTLPAPMQANLRLRRIGQLCRSIEIRDNRVRGCYWGRGVSVVGGKDVLISRNVISDTYMGAGIIIAREAGYQTFGVERVTVANNSISNVQVGTPTYDVLATPIEARRTGHGVIEVHAAVLAAELAVPELRREFAVREIRLASNSVSNSSTQKHRVGVSMTGTEHGLPVVNGDIEAIMYLD